MTTEAQTPTVDTGVEVSNYDTTPVPASPAPVADDQKPAESVATPADTETPAPVADAQKPEPEVTPEQEAERKLSRRQRAYQRERDQRIRTETELKAAREELARHTQQTQREAQSPQSGEPKREDFDDYEKYLRTVAKFEAEQVADRKLSAERESRAADSQRANQEKLSQEWTKRESEFQKQAKDYDEVVNAFVDEELKTLSPQARGAIVELGPELLYHLAKHPEEADRLAELSPVRQVAELGKIEAKLGSAEVKASKAPAPMTPINRGQTPQTGYRDDMSDAEYKVWRKGHGARWASH